MTRKGRKPLGPQLVDHLQGSPQAKQRLQVILETVTADRTIPDACTALGIGESMLHRVRSETLQAALDRLEPRPLGRPAKVQSPEAARVEELEHEIEQLKVELQAAFIRLELAQAFPHLQRDRSNRLKKTTKRPQARPQARRQVLASAPVAPASTSPDSDVAGTLR